MHAMAKTDFAKHAKQEDLAARLAQKTLRRIHTEPEKQLDLLIVVDQMLTGFDSKWVNTLYLDKVIEYQNIIQAFSRTNRLFGPDKPHGTIRYYRYPHTMQRHIEAAVKLYSGDRPIGLFVDRLENNLEVMNELLSEITDLFASAGVSNLENLPSDSEACAKFADLFKAFNQHLEAAKVQGFHWNELTYSFGEDDGKREVAWVDEQAYLSLALRYQNLQEPMGAGVQEEMFLLTLLAILQNGADKINSDYMNAALKNIQKNKSRSRKR